MKHVNHKTSNINYLFCSKGQEIVDKTILTIKKLVEAGELQEGQYGFLTYLMSKPELSYKDLSIITLSLFGDGLGTVRSLHFMHCVKHFKLSTSIYGTSIVVVTPYVLVFFGLAGVVLEVLC